MLFVQLQKCLFFQLCLECWRKMYSNIIWNSAARVAEREKAEIFLETSGKFKCFHKIFLKPNDGVLKSCNTILLFRIALLMFPLRTSSFSYKQRNEHSSSCWETKETARKASWVRQLFRGRRVSMSAISLWYKIAKLLKKSMDNFFSYLLTFLKFWLSELVRRKGNKLNFKISYFFRSASVLNLQYISTQSK